MWRTGAGIDAGRLFVFVGCVSTGVCVWWLFHCAVLYSSIPLSLMQWVPRPISLWPERLHCCIRPLIILFACYPCPSLLTTWVCDHVWSHCVARQKSSHKVPHFAPDTWSGVQHCWFIHAIHSCANAPGRGGSRLLEERQNTNEHHGWPV